MRNPVKYIAIKKDDLVEKINRYQTHLLKNHYRPHFIGIGCNLGDGNGYSPQYSGLAPKTETFRGQIAEVEMLALDIGKAMIEPVKTYSKIWNHYKPKK